MYYGILIFPSRPAPFGEYLLVPGAFLFRVRPYGCQPLKNPAGQIPQGEEACPLEMNIPMVSAITQSVYR